VPANSGQTTWADLLRAAIEQSGKSRYEIAKATDGAVDQAQLSRFMAGGRTLTLDTAEKIGRVLGVELVVPKRRAKPG
jgi:plasmid maintenance system antidote protein VapI